MSFIEEQRKTVNESNNTAQEDFLNVLEHLNPLDKNIIVRQPLSGELDFDILQKCNFNNIESIYLSAGDITSLKNIPDGIRKLVCGENLLIDVVLPASVIELDIHKNYVKRLHDLPPNLKILNVTDNDIHSLENLPTKLEELYCNNNSLQTLNLQGIEHLKVLHCSNNNLLVVEHLPDTLEDFVMENDISTQINRTTDTETVENKEDTIEKRANYLDCLYTYLELKQRYNNQLRLLKRDIYRKSKTKKAAKLRLTNLKPKCIECNRPVGTIFKNKGRKYIAKCGDETAPCSLDIQLFAGEYDRVSSLLDYYNHSIENIKQKMIIDKLDVVLNYITEEDGVELFKESIDFYTKENVHFNLLKKEYDNFYFNEENDEKMNKKNKKIKEIQERIEEVYKTSGEDATVFKDAMTIYTEELLPEIANMQNMKYQSQEIDEKDGVYKMYQYPRDIHNYEYTFGEYPKVIKFRVKNT